MHRFECESLEETMRNYYKGFDKGPQKVNVLNIDIDESSESFCFRIKLYCAWKFIESIKSKIAIFTALRLI